jgi:hypothetical protein
LLGNITSTVFEVDNTFQRGLGRKSKTPILVTGAFLLSDIDKVYFLAAFFFFGETFFATAFFAAFFFAGISYSL